jgi:hypothetical protein
MYGNVLKEFAAAQFLVTKLRDSYPPARSLAELTHIGLGALQPTELVKAGKRMIIRKS